MVGSWPRPAGLLRSLRARQRGQISREEFDRVADDAVLSAVGCQLEAGLDILTDGEQRRDNFYSFVADKLDGVQLMSLAEMLDVVEDRAGFERILQTLDVPAYAIMNPTCVGRIERRRPLAVDELRFVQGITDKPIKVPLPGPYILTRAMWVSGLSRDVYPTKEDLADDVVRVLCDEVRELTAAGVEFIQFDEPVLTELVFTQGQTRTFMCAALSASNDPAEELEFAVGLINRVAEAAAGTRVGLHICRGNWSQTEATLLRGGYHPLVPYLDRINVQQLVLEYATPRAGSVVAVAGKELGLGVVNPRTPDVESPEQIAAAVREARAVTGLSPDQVFLNPDCGFGTFSRRPMNTTDVAIRKLDAMVAAAHVLRAEVAMAEVAASGLPAVPA